MSANAVFRLNGDYTDHRFGKESTVDEIVKRISWEIELEGFYRKQGNNAIADAHALTRVAYTDLLVKRSA